MLPATTRGLPASAFVLLAVLLVVLAILPGVAASVGDRLPEFRECLEVCSGPGLSRLMIYGS